MPERAPSRRRRYRAEPELAASGERRHILATLEHTGGNKTRAAELLGVSRSTLWKKMRHFEDER